MKRTFGLSLITLCMLFLSVSCNDDDDGDAVRRISKIIDENNNTSTFLYDKNNLLNTIISSMGSERSNYIFGNNKLVRVDKFALTKTNETQNPSSFTEFTYDKDTVFAVTHHNLGEEKEEVSNDTLIINAKNQLVKIISGHVENIEYDKFGNLVKRYLFEYKYDDRTSFLKGINQSKFPNWYWVFEDRGLDVFVGENNCIETVLSNKIEGNVIYEYDKKGYPVGAEVQNKTTIKFIYY